jgi:hypothetical protein
MKNILLGLGAIAVLAGTIILIKLNATLRAAARSAPFHEDVDKLFAGLQQYKQHLGSYPTGGNAQVVNALLGKNPKSIIILVNLKTQLNDKGEILDPWGTPLRVYFSDQNVLVRSAGPNRRFDDTASKEFDDTLRSQ